MTANASIYEPLHLPEDDPQAGAWRSRIRHFVVDGFRMSHKAKALVAQMKQRETDSRGGLGTRTRNAASWRKEIAEIIQDEIGWPNSNFIPEDPFSLVICNIHWDGYFMDGMEVECIAMRMEELTGIDAFDEDAWTAYWELTFGEVVDALLRDPTDPAAVIKKVCLWPSEGPNALEALSCTAPAIFFDIRKFLTQEKYGVSKPSLRLSTPLQTLFQKVPSYELEHYLARRFNVASDVLRTFSSELDMAKAGMVGTLIVVAAFSGLLLALDLRFPDAADSSMWLLPIMFGVIGLGVTFWFGLPGFLSRPFWPRHKRLKTVKDLVEHIQKERARVNAQPTHQ